MEADRHLELIRVLTEDQCGRPLDLNCKLRDERNESGALGAPIDEVK